MLRWRLTVVSSSCEGSSSVVVAGRLVPEGERSEEDAVELGGEAEAW